MSITYSYDALGRLIERRASGSSTTTNRMYYAGWQSVAEYNGSGSLQTKYVYGPGIDEPIRTTHYSPVTTQYYFHADALGSVTEITGSSGGLVEQYRYDVYGQPTIYDSSFIPHPSSLISNRLLFTGRDRDPDTGLYNFRYRYYSPTLGRFVQPDPAGVLGGDLNLYRYAGNNPINIADSFGLSWQSIVGHLVVGVAVGLAIAVVVSVAAPVVVGALLAAGVSSAIITTGAIVIGAGAAATGVIYTGLDVYDADWDAVAFDIGSFAGGAAYLGLTEGLPSSWWASEKALGYDSGFPGGSVPAWWAKMPTGPAWSGVYAATGFGIGTLLAPSSDTPSSDPCE